MHESITLKVYINSMFWYNKPYTNETEYCAMTKTETIDFYSGYYADLLSQMTNMSVTQQSFTKLEVKRALLIGMMDLADLKAEISAMEFDIAENV